eukprot:Stramenopile-MAST_4_protein_2202
MSVAMSQDGLYIVSGSGDETVKLWSVTSGECVKTFEGHSDRVTYVAMSLDGLYIVSGSYDKTVKLWIVTSGECVFTGPQIPSSRRAEFPLIPDFFEHFDDTDTIGLSGNGGNTRPRVCFGKTHAVILDADKKTLHFLERRS